LEINAMGVRNARGVEEARRQLPALIEEAHRGRATLITKRGKPYAALVSPALLAQARRGPDIRALRGSGKRLWGKSPARAINKIRREWE
jgi:prevent-host-death family protein